MDRLMLNHLFFILSGAIVIAAILLDVFLTVLYARVSAGFISHRLACWTWWCFRTFTGPFKRSRDTILSFCGPSILVLLVCTWAIGLMIGGALVTYPNLGSAVQAHSGETPRSFALALYIAGDAMTTVGS